MSGPKKLITKVLEAHAVSFVPRGDDPQAYVVLRKAMKPKLETEDMDTKTMKALLGFDDVTKAHFLALDDAGCTAFLAKSADEQKAEVEAAVKAAAKKPADDGDDDDMTKKGYVKADTIAEIVKNAVAGVVAPLTAEIAALKAAGEESTIRKRAETEFAGYPGGVESALTVLKGLAGLPEETRTSVETTMKSHIDLAKRVSHETGSREVAKGSAAEMLEISATAAVETAKAAGQTTTTLAEKGKILQTNDELLLKGFTEEVAKL